MKSESQLLVKRVPAPSDEDKSKNAAYELDQDRLFAAEFSSPTLLKYYLQITDFIKKRGWDPTTLEKNGISLQSFEAFSDDRASAATLDDYLASEKLSDYVQRANPDQLRALRIAYETGIFRTEAAAYRQKTLGRGRKSNRASAFAALTAAHKKWIKSNPTEERAPRSSELYELYTGPNLGGKANFRNVVSEWRKISAK